jgi:hypothetical protein
MTSPGDDDELEEALRRALSEAASEVEPGSDGLDKIHERIAGRPPRRWLASVLFGVVERVRNWTWRGHWAWPDWRSRLAEVRWPHLRRGRFPGWGIRSLRLAAVLAGVAVIAIITVSVQPLRQAIVQASNDLQGGTPPRAAAGAGGIGTPAAVAGNGTSPTAAASPGAGRTGTGSAPGMAKAPGAAKPRSSATGKCGTAAQTAGPSPAVTDAPAPVASATVTLARLVSTDTPAVACPVPSSSAKSPTPTPTSDDPASASATTAASSSPAGYGWSGPSAAPPWSRQGRRQHESRYDHSR